MTETLAELDRRQGDEGRAAAGKGSEVERRHAEEREAWAARFEHEEAEKDKTRPKANLRERMGLFWDRRCTWCGQGDTFPNVPTCGWSRLTGANPGGGDPPCLGGDVRSREDQRERLRTVWARWAVAGAITLITLAIIGGWPR